MHHGESILTVIARAAGKMLWRAWLPGSLHSSPIVSEVGVFTAVPGAGCVQSFDLLTGKKIWALYDCHAGTGRTPALFNGVLSVHNPPEEGTGNLLVDVAAEQATGTFEADAIPAFHDKRGFFLAKGALSARDLPARTEAWSFKGDGMLVSAPIVVNGNVYLGSSTGMLDALDAVTGNLA